jgi:hypothetical protein
VCASISLFAASLTRVQASLRDDKSLANAVQKAQQTRTYVLAHLAAAVAGRCNETIYKDLSEELKEGEA